MTCIGQHRIDYFILLFCFTYLFILFYFILLYVARLLTLFSLILFIFIFYRLTRELGVVDQLSLRQVHSKKVRKIFLEGKED